MELNWPSGFDGSKKTSVGSLNLRLDAPSDARLERASLRRWWDEAEGRSSSGGGRFSAPRQHLKKDMILKRGLKVRGY